MLPICFRTRVRKPGHPQHGWTNQLVGQVGDWQVLGQNQTLSMQLCDDFEKSCSTRWCFVSHRLRPKRGCFRTRRCKVKVKAKVYTINEQQAFDTPCSSMEVKNRAEPKPLCQLAAR